MRILLIPPEVAANKLIALAVKTGNIDAIVVANVNDHSFVKDLHLVKKNEIITYDQIKEEYKNLQAPQIEEIADFWIQRSKNTEIF